jgi:hypothetical protein
MLRADVILVMPNCSKCQPRGWRYIQQSMLHLMQSRCQQSCTRTLAAGGVRKCGQCAVALEVLLNPTHTSHPSCTITLQRGDEHSTMLAPTRWCKVEAAKHGGCAKERSARVWLHMLGGKEWPCQPLLVTSCHNTSCQVICYAAVQFWLH